LEDKEQKDEDFEPEGPLVDLEIALFGVIDDVVDRLTEHAEEVQSHVIGNIALVLFEKEHDHHGDLDHEHEEEHID